jgi:hypothetical protein
MGHWRRNGLRRHARPQPRGESARAFRSPGPVVCAFGAPRFRPRRPAPLRSRSCQASHRSCPVRPVTSRWKVMFRRDRSRPTSSRSPAGADQVFGYVLRCTFCGPLAQIAADAPPGLYPPGLGDRFRKAHQPSTPGISVWFSAISRCRPSRLQERCCHRTRVAPSAKMVISPVDNVDIGDRIATALIWCSSPAS